MTDSTDSDQYFTQAVAELGEKQPVIASCAIFNANGVKIVEKGTTINLGLYERLMQHKLSAPIESCVSSSNTVTGRQEGLALVTVQLQKIQRALPQVDAVIAKIGGFETLDRVNAETA